MKPKYILFFAVFFGCFVPVLSYGQGIFIPARTVTGTVNGITRPVPGATVTVCDAKRGGIPCSPPLANAVFQDSGLTVPLSNPFFTDANGNYPQAALAPGIYTITESAPGFVGFSYQVTMSCAPGTSCNVGPFGAISATSATITGAVTAGSVNANNPIAGANDLTLGIENRRRYVCNLSSAYRFQTIAAGIADITTNSPNGGIVETCPGHTETITTQVDIGNGTAAVALYLGADNHITCNLSAGAAAYCLGIHNASALVGFNNGAVGASRNGGAYIKEACTDNSGYVVTTVEGLSNQQGYGYASHLFIEGCATGTVGAGSPAVAMLNIEGISSMNQWDNIQVINFPNTIGIRVASNNVGGHTEVVGPLVLTNMWADGSALTGARPWVIKGTTSGVLPLSIVGGVANHPPAGGTAMEINGNGASLIYGGLISGMFFEDLNNNGSIMLKLIDVTNLDTSGLTANLGTTDTFVDISQSGAGRTCNLHLFGMRQANAGTLINNHISGVVQSGQLFQPFYVYGGDGSCAITSVNFDSIPIGLFNGAAFNTNVSLANGADAAQSFALNPGATATQIANLNFSDRGTIKWDLEKDASNNFQILNNATGGANFFANPAGTVFLGAPTGQTVLFKVNNVNIATVNNGGILAGGAAAGLTGTGACATFSGQLGGAWAGKASCTGTTGASTITITPGSTATNGWVCDVWDETTRANVFQQTSHTQTTCVVTATSVTQNDVFVFKAIAF